MDATAKQENVEPIYTHYSKVRLGALSVKDPHDPTFSYKPRGLWYSVDGDWERWCAAAMPDWIDGLRRHRVFIGPGCRVLRLTTVGAVRDFHEEYGLRDTNYVHRALSPDWRRVGQEWDGIEIAPYQWDLRFDSDVNWYYPWDCASGVIWRPTDVVIEQWGDATAQVSKT